MAKKEEPTWPLSPDLQAFQALEGKLGDLYEEWNGGRLSDKRAVAQAAAAARKFLLAVER